VVPDTASTAVESVTHDARTGTILTDANAGPPPDFLTVPTTYPSLDVAGPSGEVPHAASARLIQRPRCRRPATAARFAA